MILNCVLYKGHCKLSCTQLCTGMSFTLNYKGHTIVIGPERASRYLRNFALNTLQYKVPEEPLKEHIIKLS